jgi:hypothetical protein
MEEQKIERHQKKHIADAELWNDSFKKSIDVFLSSVKKIWKSVYEVIINNEKDFWVIFFLALWTLWLMIYLSLRVYNNTVYINKRYMDLEKLDKYTISESFRSNEEFRSLGTINEIIDSYNWFRDDKSKYDGYLKELSTSYEYLLQYIYLPRLNIWKDLYINKIHTDMIWIKFLENNPYSDSALIDKWTSFFQNVWENNESNTVSDVSVGNFIEDDRWFFKIPITLSFESNSKRSFLLLLDKLLTTSNQENVWLINEFMYYLIQNIKSEKSEWINQIAENLKSEFSWDYFSTETGLNNVNKIVGFSIYNRLYWSWDATNIIDDSIINKTVKDTVSCEDNLDINVCYYRFRDKYRNIPEMAYNIWRMIIDVDRTVYLKNFLKKLPPIISIKDLSFTKVRADNVVWADAMKYKWKIIIDVFGKWISSPEVDEISSALWEQCLGKWIALNASVALKKVDDYINKLSWIADLNFDKSKNMWELNDLIKKIESDYPGFTNYNKVIKLFELYRMLNDSNLCLN